MKNKMIFLALAVWFTFSSCSDFLFFGDSASSPKEISEMNLEEVARAIDKEVGEADADQVSNCKILPIGDKPCGGPWGYLVYSNKKSDTVILTELIERYDKLDKIRNEEEGRVSTCDVAQEPVVSLEDGFCKGQGPYAWNPGKILKRNSFESND